MGGGSRRPRCNTSVAQSLAEAGNVPVQLCVAIELRINVKDSREPLTAGSFVACMVESPRHDLLSHPGASVGTGGSARLAA